MRLNRTVVVYLAFVVLAAVQFVFVDNYILGSLFSILCLTSFLFYQYNTIQFITGRSSVVSIGFFNAIFISGYFWIPILGLLAFSGYSSMSDGRLIKMEIGLPDVYGYAREVLLYIVASTGLYTVLINARRNTRAPLLPGQREFGSSYFYIAHACIAAVYLPIKFIYFSGDYGDFFNTAPPLVASFYSKLTYCYNVSQVGVIFCLFMKVSKGTDIFLRSLVLFCIGIALFSITGSRGELFSLVVPVLLTLSFTGVLKERHLLALFFLLGIFMLLLGFIRSDGQIESIVDTGLLSFLIAANEFTSIMGTNLDVRVIMTREVDIPLSIYLNDFLMLLPGFLFPGGKIDGASWYLIMNGWDGQGVGYMWGVLSQAAIGFGAFEVFVRGSLVGIFMSQVQRYLERNIHSKFAVISYLYITIFMFLAFRNTTGILLALLIYGVGLFFIALWIFKVLVPLKSRVRA